MAYSLKQFITPELTELLNDSQKDFIERAIAEFFRHLKTEITQAISELQILENELSSNPDFEISDPKQFTYHQYKLVRPVILSFMEHLEKELKASEDEGAREVEE